MTTTVTTALPRVRPRGGAPPRGALDDAPVSDAERAFLLGWRASSWTP